MASTRRMLAIAGSPIDSGSRSSHFCAPDGMPGTVVAPHRDAEEARLVRESKRDGACNARPDLYVGFSPAGHEAGNRSAAVSVRQTECGSHSGVCFVDRAAPDTQSQAS